MGLVYKKLKFDGLNIMRFELSEIFNYREKLFYLKSLRFFKLLS